MASLEIHSNCALTPWTDYARERLLPGQLERVGLMPNGTSGGRPALMLGIRIDGYVVVAQTTWAIWQAVMQGLANVPVAVVDRAAEEGQDTDLETLTTAYEAKLRAQGMREFAGYLEAHPLPIPCRSSVYATLAREQADQAEAGGHA